MSDKEQTGQEGVTDACASVVKNINVNAFNEQQSQGILMEKALKVFTIETRQALQERIKKLKSEEDAFEITALAERNALKCKAEAVMRAHWAQDTELSKLVQALRTFGVAVTKTELDASVSLRDYGGGAYGEFSFLRSRPGFVTYEVGVKMSVCDDHVEVTRYAKSPPALVDALRVWKRTAQQGQRMLDNIELLEKELKALPEKTASLEAQVLRQQIGGDSKHGAGMIAMLDAAKEAGTGQFLALL